MLLVIALTPLFIYHLGGRALPSLGYGHFGYYLTAFPWGWALLLLTVRPVDATAIRGVGAFLVCFFVLLALLFVLLAGSLTFLASVAGVYAAVALLCVLAAAALWPLVACDCRGYADDSRWRWPPRRMLHRLWLVTRLALLSLAAILAVFNPHLQGRFAPTWRADDLHSALLASIASCLLAALVLTPATRGRVLRRLGEVLNERGTKAQEAASVAALLGSRSAASTLAAAAKRFRALPLLELTRTEIAHNKPDPEMHRKTVKAKLGEVDAFASHSWSDDGDAKFDGLHEWAEGMPRMVWLDKACIDQLAIEASLACLPVFLAGCKQLLVLAGQTYPTRLWCTMELFVYIQVCGTCEAIVLKLLDDSTNLAESLHRFDAAKAKCYLDKDRQRLLAVIETSFGTMAPFNAAVRGIFAERLHAPTEGLHVRTHVGPPAEGLHGAKAAKKHPVSTCPPSLRGFAQVLPE